MNIALCNIIRRIIAEQGESILAEPQRLKGWISDYAQNEPKPERLAFGRCIEAGAYTELKKAASPDERRRVKAALAQRLHNDQGLDPALCAGALDVLEAALWGTAELPPPVPPSVPPSAAVGNPGTTRIILSTVIFSAIGGILGGVAGGIGLAIFGALVGGTVIAIVGGIVVTIWAVFDWCFMSKRNKP